MIRQYKFLFLGVLTLATSAAVAIIWSLYLFPEPRRIPQSTVDYQRALLSLEALNHHIQQETCPCNFSEFPESDFKTENPSSCSSQRTTHEPLFQQLPPHYIQSRTQGSFPRECVTFIMNRFGPRNQRSALFATCNRQSLKPTRGGFKPCVTDQYVNVTYTLFNDISTCMGINPKYLIPKITQESGFHLNAFGAGADTGIGQLTGPAIRDVNKHFRSYQNHILSSDRESCQRLRPVFANLTPAPSSTASRCSLMRAPENPALNLFYSAVKLQIDYRTQDLLFERMGVNRLLRQAGLANVDRKKLRVVLMTLAYNAGAGGAMRDFINYLEYRIALRQKGVRGATPRDLDITANLNRPNPNQHPLSFSQYLLLHQGTGTKGYLSRLKSQANELDRAFFPGACTLNNFLQVSTEVSK